MPLHARLQVLGTDIICEPLSAVRLSGQTLPEVLNTYLL